MIFQRWPVADGASRVALFGDMPGRFADVDTLALRSEDAGLAMTPLCFMRKAAYSEEDAECARRFTEPFSPANIMIYRRRRTMPGECSGDSSRGFSLPSDIRCPF